MLIEITMVDGKKKSYYSNNNTTKSDLKKALQSQTFIEFTDMSDRDICIRVDKIDICEIIDYSDKK